MKELLNDPDVRGAFTTFALIIALGAVSWVADRRKTRRETEARQRMAARMRRVEAERARRAALAAGRGSWR